MSFDGQITPVATETISIPVNKIAARKIAELARERGQRPTQYAGDLFMAAFTCRVKPEASMDAELAAAVNGHPSPVAPDARVANLQRALDALRENYHALQAENDKLRSTAFAAASGELLELRRKNIEFETVIARTKKEAADKIGAARKDADEAKKAAAEKLRIWKGKATGYEQQCLKLRRDITELTKQLATATDGGRIEATLDDAEKRIAEKDAELQRKNAILADMQRDAEELRARLATAQEAADRAQAEYRLIDADRKTLRAKIVELTGKIDLLKERIAEQQAAAMDQKPVELPQVSEAAQPSAELDKVWSAIKDLANQIDALSSSVALLRALKEKPPVVDPQVEAENLDVLTTRTIRAHRSTGKNPVEIHAAMPHVSVGAIKIVCRLAPSKTQQALAEAKADAAKAKAAAQ